MKKPEKLTIKLKDEDSKKVLQVAEILGCDTDCALNAILLQSLMQLGEFSSKKEYDLAVKEIEDKFGVSLKGKLLPYKKGGDPEFQKNFSRNAAKARAKKK